MTEAVAKPKKFYDTLFIDLFEPKKFEHFVLPKRIRSHFPDGKIVGNNLLYGVQGCGKSSLAKFLAKEENFFYVNSSLDTSIDSLREDGELYTWCSTMSWDTKQKVVLFDEIDGVSANFFLALKGFMDTFKKNVRFLATTNHKENIPPPILSRFELVDYSFENQEEERAHFKSYCARISNIATKALKMEADEESIKGFCERFFPDFRGTLQTLQRLTNNGVTKIDAEVIKKKSFEHVELYGLILRSTISDIRDLHTQITGISNPLYALQTIDRELIEYLRLNSPKHTRCYADMIITIAKYNNMVTNRVDPTLCLKALVFELVKITTIG